MKYLITGGAGFIGSHLIELLIEKNFRVVCVDDLSTGNLSNLSSVIKKIDFYEEKIETFDFKNLNKIDGIIHLAAQTSVPRSITHFHDSSSNNLLGAIKVIDYCKSNCIPLVYASSSAIYGNLGNGDDQINKFDLLSPYAVDKYSMELYSETVHKISQLSSLGLRFFNVYGPRQDHRNPYSGVISIFASRLLKRQKLFINGGQQKRDFIYVKDVVDIIYRAMMLTNDNVICEVCNVLTGKTLSINDLAEKMMDITKIKVDINYRKLPEGEPINSNGSYKNMIKLFRVQPEKFTKLNIGLMSTFEHISKSNCLP